MSPVSGFSAKATIKFRKAFGLDLRQTLSAYGRWTIGERKTRICLDLFLFTVYFGFAPSPVSSSTSRAGSGRRRRQLEKTAQPIFAHRRSGDLENLLGLGVSLGPEVVAFYFWPPADSTRGGRGGPQKAICCFYQAKTIRLWTLINTIIAGANDCRAADAPGERLIPTRPCRGSKSVSALRLPKAR